MSVRTLARHCYYQEELGWLGKRLASEWNTGAGAGYRIDMLNLKQAEAGDDDDEPSVVLPQAPHPLKNAKRRPGVP